MKIKKICQQCGGPIITTPCQIKRKKYCCKDCYSLSMRIPRVKKICQNCGVEFDWYQDVPHHKGIYCSKKCLHARGGNFHGGPVKIKCEYCGITRIRKRYTMRQNHHFCSPSCHLSWQYRNDSQLKKFGQYWMFGHDHNDPLSVLDQRLIDTRIQLFRFERSLQNEQ